MALASLYSAFTKAENRVGGGEGLVGIYGSMTQAGTCSIMGAFVDHAGMQADSVLVDIGSGLCRPLLHATVEYGVKQTYGVELDAVKCQKAIPFVQHTVTMMGANGHTFPSKSLPVVICASAEELGSLEPATHAYAAWEGFPVSAMKAIGRLFRCSRTLKAIIIVQRSMRNQDPAEVMEELGFGQVECKAAAMPVFMAGSGRKLNAYLFVKPDDYTHEKVPADAGPSLATATPFNADLVLNDLARMSRQPLPSESESPQAERSSQVTRSTHNAQPSVQPSKHGLRPRKDREPTVSSSGIAQSSQRSTEVPGLTDLTLASPTHAGTNQQANKGSPGVTQPAHRRLDLDEPPTLATQDSEAVTDQAAKARPRRGAAAAAAAKAAGAAKVAEPAATAGSAPPAATAGSAPPAAAAGVRKSTRARK